MDNMDYIDINNSSNNSNGKKDKKKTDNSRRVTWAVRITSGVLALIFTVVGFVLFYGYNLIQSVNYEDVDDGDGKDMIQNPHSQNSGSGSGNDLSGTEVVYKEGELLSNKYVLNIMLFGADRYGDQGLSDTMILLSIDNLHKKIKMTSFLRDTYVSIPGQYPHKLNLAYALDGAGLSIRTIEANFGIQIDRYATVNFSTFKDIVDILGGVELYVTDNEIGYINAQIAYNGQSEYLYASEGMVTLNGQQALWYARNRGGTFNGITYGGDDWDRTDRQRKFLEAVINNVKDASLSELIQIVNKIGPSITTNLKKTEIQTLLTNALTYLNYEVEQCSMPPDGSWSYGWNEAGSVILIDDWNAARRNLAEFIYEDALKIE